MGCWESEESNEEFSSRAVKFLSLFSEWFSISFDTFFNWATNYSSTLLYPYYDSLITNEGYRSEAFTIMSNLSNAIKRMVKCNLIDASIPQGRYKIHEGKDKQVGRERIGPFLVRHIADLRKRKYASSQKYALSSG